jgi:hypothetical protein
MMVLERRRAGMSVVQWNESGRPGLMGWQARSNRACFCANALTRIVLMMIFQIVGGIFVLLFLAAAMTGIEGNEYR